MISLGGHQVRLFSDFWRVLREFNPEDIDREAEQPFEIVVVGGSGVDPDALARDLAAGAPPLSGSQFIRAMRLPTDGFGDDVPRGDVVVHLIDASTGLTALDRKLAVALFRSTHPVVLVFTSGIQANGATPSIASLEDARQAVSDLFGTHGPNNVLYLGDSPDGADTRSVLNRILDAAPHKQLSIGRHLPAARSTVAIDVVLKTSLANAQFALMSSLPANIPILGGFVGSGADFVVLTKNQALMVFRLAALYGRSRSPKVRMIAEIAPVVGAAFLWRTIARTAIGMLPSFVSVVPKTMVAFIGTYIVGRAAQHYYATGSRPTEADLARFSAEASTAWGDAIHLRQPDAGFAQ